MLLRSPPMKTSFPASVRRTLLGAAWLSSALCLSAQSDGIAVVRHAPVISGQVEGSIRQLLAESVTLNGGAAISGDLFIPGTPAIRLNGQPIYGGTIDGSGAAAPATHRVTLNGRAALRSVVRRTDPLPLGAVPPPPLPLGTRDVVLNGPGGNAGDFATLRHLTLNGSAGEVAIPPGTYGDFTANGSGRFILGTSGATVPAEYALQRLTLNGQAQLRVAGPVVLTVAHDVVVSGTLGASGDPALLTLRISSGGLTLNGQAAVYGHAEAPAGGVIINGGAQLAGGVAADRLTLNGNGRLRLLPRAQANQAPMVTLTHPPEYATLVAPATFILRATATDADGTITRVEFHAGTSRLGEDTIAPFEWPVTATAAGTLTYYARATDDRGATADSPPVTVVVTAPNQPPVITLAPLPNGGLMTAPATFTLEAAAHDPDGLAVRVEFRQDGALIGEDPDAPFTATVTGLGAGTYGFTARVFDERGASTDSALVTATVVTPNLAPTVAIVGPAGGAFAAPARFTVQVTASDPDGAVTKVELFRGTTKVGETVAPPYQFEFSQVQAGEYSFVARATDDRGAATDSDALSVVVTSTNAAPLVAVTSPAPDAVFSAPVSLDLAAAVADPDGSVVTVQFFAGDVRLGEDADAPFVLTWPDVPPGNYEVWARATDNSGGATDSARIAFTVQASLPYFTSFEAAHGFRLAALAGQAGWAAAGAVQVVDTAAFEGVQSVHLAGQVPPAELAHAFPPYSGMSVVFVDYFLRPTAAPSVSGESTARTDFAQVAWVAAGGGHGEFYALAGNGNGGTQWMPTGVRRPIDADGLTLSWLRLTLRGDFSTRTWDLYEGGRLVAADRRFMDDTALRLTQFALSGHAAGSTRFDDFFAGFENPLFTDADRDGLADAWELANGLDPSVNDRGADRDGDGLTNVVEFQLGTLAGGRDSDTDGVPDGLELALGRDPLKGAVPDSGGVVNLRLYSPAR